MFDQPENDSNAKEVMPNNLSSGEAEPGSLHKVGYASPPLHTRFQKGVYGNPYGRTKPRPTADEILLADADRVIKVQENGRRIKMSGEQLIYARLTLAATKGGFKAIRDLFAAMARLEREYGWGNVGWNKESLEEFWKREWKKLDSGR